MARKRAPGGGRKPKGEIRGKSAVFSTRITPATRKKLEAAAKASGRSLSQEVERRLEDSFGIQHERHRFLKALFYLMSHAATRLPPNWREDPWGRQAFKAAAIATLNRHIPNQRCKAPEKIKMEWPDVTPEGYGKLLEWDVNLFLQMAPDDFPSGFPTGSVVYAMPQARHSLGIPFDAELSRTILSKLGEPDSNYGEKK